ncbi:MauE/DoxX family redox-associated membrane protein [Spirosoma arboris]|nr:MauE/DoxX family redox-associated membrane protein [Spirosoma arboris]
MDFALLLVQVSLSLVFVIAAFAKLVSVEKTKRAVADFGIPGKLSFVVALLLSLSELVIGLLLQPFCWPWFGASAALFVLTIFTVAIVYHLLRGNSISCNCFGEMQTKLIGWTTVIRNGFFMSMAIFILTVGPSLKRVQVATWMSALPADQFLALLINGLTLFILIIGGWYIVYLLKNQGNLSLKLAELEGRLINIAPTKGLPIGAFAPFFSLLNKNNETETLTTLLASQKPLLLFFVNPDCGPCNQLLPKIVEWNNTYVGRLRIALITMVSSKGTSPPDYAILKTLIEQDRVVSKSFQSMSMPSAVLIRPDGTIGSPLAIGELAIRNLINWVLDEDKHTI